MPYNEISIFLSHCTFTYERLFRVISYFACYLVCCMFCEVFVDNLTLETSGEFSFVTTRGSANGFPQTRSELATIKFP